MSAARPHMRKLAPWARSYVRKAFRLRNQLTDKVLCAKLGVSKNTLRREARSV